MKLSDLRRSRYLRKEDVGDGIVVTISDFQEENVAPAGQKPDKRWVMHFDGDTKPLVLNATNGDLLAALFGDNPDDWIGKRVELFNDLSVSFQGKRGGVRVRAVKATPKAEPVTAEPGTDEDIPW